MPATLRSLLCAALLLGFVSVVASDVVLPTASAADAADDPEGEKHDGEEHHGDEHHETGPPLGLKADLFLWSVIVFGILLVILGKFAWSPLTSALDAREAKIRDDIAAAEANRVRAERMMKEHEAKMAAAQDEVKEIIAEARRDADQARENILADANSEAKATKERALHDIERARDQALKEIFATLNDQVTAATEHVLGRGFNDDDQRRLVGEALDQLPQS